MIRRSGESFPSRQALKPRRPKPPPARRIGSDEQTMRCGARERRTKRKRQPTSSSSCIAARSVSRTNALVRRSEWRAREPKRLARRLLQEGRPGRARRAPRYRCRRSRGVPGREGLYHLAAELPVRLGGEDERGEPGVVLQRALGGFPVAAGGTDRLKRQRGAEAQADDQQQRQREQSPARGPAVGTERDGIHPSHISGTTYRPERPSTSVAGAPSHDP